MAQRHGFLYTPRRRICTNLQVRLCQSQPIYELFPIALMSSDEVLK